MKEFHMRSEYVDFHIRENPRIHFSYSRFSPVKTTINIVLMKAAKGPQGQHSHLTLAFSWRV